MKQTFIILMLILVILLFTIQPKDMLQESSIPWSGTAPWQDWFQDKRVSPLSNRVSDLEAQRLQEKLAGLETQLATSTATMTTQQQKMVALEQTLEQQLAKLRTLEQKADHLALLDQRLAVLENGSSTVKKRDKGWKLIDMFSRLRQLRRNIAFVKPFSTLPKIMLGITLINIPGEQHMRFFVRAEEVTTHGFTLVFETRSDNRIEEAQVDWLAFSVGSSTLKPAQ